MAIILVAAATFFLCWLLDKGFQKAFRSAPQHMSGKSVRLNKYNGLAGVILVLLGVVAMLFGGETIMLVGGGIVLLMGIGFMIRYMGFGVFYDEDSFLVMSAGKKNREYRYNQIKSQQLYRNGGHVLVELHMTDGTAVQVQSNMVGVYPFLDTAFEGWCHQKGIDPASCEFHDPDNSCWFPALEAE